MSEQIREANIRAALDWAYAQSPDKGNQRSILIFMAIEAVGPRRVRSSLDTIVCKGLSERTARKHLAALEASKFIRLEWISQNSFVADLLDTGEQKPRRVGRVAEISPEQRDRILARDKHTCRGCGSVENLNIDHDMPLIRDGSDDDSNLQVLCGTCNSSKGSKTMAEWLAWRAARVAA